jgi:hypothetical protein
MACAAVPYHIGNESASEASVTPSFRGRGWIVNVIERDQDMPYSSEGCADSLNKAVDFAALFGARSAQAHRMHNYAGYSVEIVGIITLQWTEREANSSKEKG